MQIQKPRQGYKLVKLGYSQLAEIPIDWEVTKINTISKIVSGTGFPLQYQKGDIGEILFIKVSDMNLPENILYIKKTNNSVSKETAKSINARLCPANTIIFPKIGATIYTHKRAMLSKESCFDNNVMGLIPQKIEPFFLFYLLSQIRLENFSQTTALPYLDDSIVGNIKIPTCELVEEQKIASILSNVDSLIQQTQKEIEQTQRLKKGLMQRLLTKGIGHNRFKKVKWLFEKNIEIPEYWKRATVSEIFQLRTGGTPSRSRPEYFSGDIPWVTSTDLNRGTITQTLEKITVEAKEKTRLKIFPKGTFVIATYGLEAAGTRGKCGILAFNATINQACMAFLPSEKMTVQFLFYFYLEYGERIAFNYAQGTKQQNLYPDTVKKIPLIVPSIKEQEKITCILSTVDSKINDLESRRSHLGNLKKGLMQKLLTGQIRVKV